MYKLIVGCLLALLSLQAYASPGCSGKFWNPLELDFTNLGPVRINWMGASMDYPPNSTLPDPPEHRPIPCNCPDGLTGTVGPTGIGLTFWLPDYVIDVARTPGCVGFLGGVQLMEKFRSLAGTENQHMPRAESNMTNQNRQRHFANVPLASMISTGIFEKCASGAEGINIAFMTEVCFPCQSDIWSMLLVPIGQILANAPILSTLACGAARVAAMVGYPPMDYVCNISGTRFPLSQTTPMGASSAQEVNTDQIAKHFTLAHLTGGGLRTIGSDTFCKPVATFVWNASQHRYQFMYPLNRPSLTHLQVNKLFFSKGAGGENAMNSPSRIDPEVKAPTSSATDTDLATRITNLASSVMKVASPLNFPTSEHAYLQIWEAKSCCIPTLTPEKIMAFVGTSFLEAGELKEMIELYQELETVLAAVQLVDSIGSLVAIASGNMPGIGAAGAPQNIAESLSTDAALEGISQSSVAYAEVVSDDPIMFALADYFH